MRRAVNLDGTMARRVRSAEELVLHNAYEATKIACKREYGSAASAKAIDQLVGISLKFLKEKCKPIPLISLVPGKKYFSFQSSDGRSQLSRPVNAAYFDHDLESVSREWKAWREGKAFDDATMIKMVYTVAMAPCAVMEVFDKGNKKGPATYFECLIGHIFSVAYGVEPREKAVFKIKNRNLRMTMDLLFDISDKQTIHMPVKMSTRERIVQAWAHQRMLDKAYGDNRYLGVMILFSETKLDQNAREVVEICVPDQWFAYQSLLAKMDRIYYFDIPAKYQELTKTYPDIITIRNFGQFFADRLAEKGDHSSH